MAAARSESRTLAHRILAVMGEVTYVQKDTLVAAGNRQYWAVSHDAVVRALRPSLVSHGILVYTRQTAEKAIEGRTASGYPKIRYEAWYEVTLVSADDTEDTMTIPIHVHAEDSGDKGPGKAASYAMKTALLKAFVLETGESDEIPLEPQRDGGADKDDMPAGVDPALADLEKPPPASKKKSAAKKKPSSKKKTAANKGPTLVDDDQVTQLQAMIAETGTDKDSMLAYYGIPDLGRLPAALFDEAMGFLQRKRGQQQ